ncbi:ABC transporter ATP-binding protein [Anaerosacchariphilus polymeriproducens]|uniref:ABC transporter ATP-binding protein n=1 Tax=Anaerosacchariphilus polymeriproducens TaxID=1812858 RepID=A0A371ASX9_9FIRM|nr:ABC transporter ATP-binding protein [Anaerosacchariphilus polymeriproducens]RDU22671.1 ABC transporter ATP-binding protein [Anaerosacchariphilus polymeriproducens]
MEPSKEYVVQMHGITKRFGSFCALNEMNLDVKSGTIHSLLGENGAGKSTLMNVLYGLYQADEGEIFLKGEKVEVKNPSDAIKLGIGMVHQHFMLLEKFTVVQNIILGDECISHLGMVDMKKARKDVMEIANKYGLHIDPDAKISDITVGMQQKVEILKALYRGAELLILDEPTAVLTPQEIQELIKIMKNLIDSGKAIIIITHKLKEIKAASDICTIVCRGKYIDTVDVKSTTESELAALMVGHDVNLVVDKSPAEPKETILEIENLVVENEKKMDAVKGLSLNVRKGEIVGIAGIDGNGQKELMDALSGFIKAKSGTIKINGKEIQNTTPRNIIDSGISIIPEDRHKRGLVLEFGVFENAVLNKYRKMPYSKKGILNQKAMEQFTNELIQECDVRPAGCTYDHAGNLSGGNQQKLIIGREVSNNPELLIAVQPTRGLDVGAIESVHKTLVRERDKGKAILLISFELDEVMNLSDTIAVIYDGKIQDTFLQGTVDENTLGLLMAGGRNHVHE